MISIKVVREFVKQIAGEKTTVRVDTYWGACGNKSIIADRSYFGINDPKVDEFNMREDIPFRTNFVKQGGPAMRDFSNFTLIILHEIGHLKTCDNFDILAYKAQVNAAETDEDYYAIPCEYAANQWAIDWLKSNRTAAKQFEAKLRAR